MRSEIMHKPYCHHWRPRTGRLRQPPRRRSCSGPSSGQDSPGRGEGSWRWTRCWDSLCSAPRSPPRSRCRPGWRGPTKVGNSTIVKIKPRLGCLLYTFCRHYSTLSRRTWPLPSITPWVNQSGRIDIQRNICGWQDRGHILCMHNLAIIIRNSDICVPAAFIHYVSTRRRVVANNK